MQRNDTSQRGFTLLELSIVLVLIAVIIGGGLMMLTARLQASQYNATVARMEEIEKALLNYAIANNRIPCPADLTLSAASANYGFEAGAGSGSAIGTATGVCSGTGMLPQANFVAASGTVEGGVPTRALQLPDDYMYDGWGRKFRYAVDPSQTKTSALPAAVYSPCGISSSGITVNDASGAARTTAAAYALLSQGANGHGAYTSNGVVLNAGSVNASELTNCHCTSAGAYSGTYTPTYVEMVPTQDPNNALDNFDDLVTFKEPWQMQAPNFPLSQSTAQCIYVADWKNYRMEVFSSQSGSFIFQFPCASGTCSRNGGGTGGGTFNWSNYANGVAVDSTGNVWVGDGAWIQKFSGSGTYISQVKSRGTGSAAFYNATDIAFDASGNLWVVDAFNNIVREINSSTGALMQVIPSSGCTLGSFPTCPASSANGQLDGPSRIGFDNNGKLWVIDNNNRPYLRSTAPVLDPTLRMKRPITSLPIHATDCDKRP